MGPNQIKAFLIQTSPTFITGVNCKVAPLSFQRNKKFCSCLIQARSKVTSHCLCRFEAFLPQLNASCWLSASNLCHQGWSFSCSWQRRDRRREETAGLAAASLAAWHHPTSARTAGSHRFLFLKPRRPSAPQGSRLQFLAPRVVSFCSFICKLDQRKPKARAEQSRAPRSHAAHSFLAFKCAFRFWFGIHSPLEATKEWRKHSKQYPPSRKSSPMWHFCSVLKADSAWRVPCANSMGFRVPPCMEKVCHTKAHHRTGDHYSCFLCSPPALSVWLALNEKSYESNNVNFTLSHQKLYPSYFLEK